MTLEDEEILAEFEAITLDQLTEEDWQDIRVLATKYYHGGFFSGHQGKCWILAFVNYLEFKRKAIIPDEMGENRYQCH